MILKILDLLGDIFILLALMAGTALLNMGVRLFPDYLLNKRHCAAETFKGAQKEAK